MFLILVLIIFKFFFYLVLSVFILLLFLVDVFVEAVLVLEKSAALGADLLRVDASDVELQPLHPRGLVVAHRARVRLDVRVEVPLEAPRVHAGPGAERTEVLLVALFLLLVVVVRVAVDRGRRRTVRCSVAVSGRPPPFLGRGVGIFNVGDWLRDSDRRIFLLFRVLSRQLHSVGRERRRGTGPSVAGSFHRPFCRVTIKIKKKNKSPNENKLETTLI